MHQSTLLRYCHLISESCCQRTGWSAKRSGGGKKSCQQSSCVKLIVICLVESSMDASFRLSRVGLSYSHRSHYLKVAYIDSLRMLCCFQVQSALQDVLRTICNTSIASLTLFLSGIQVAETFLWSLVYFFQWFILQSGRHHHHRRSRHHYLHHHLYWNLAKQNASYTHIKSIRVFIQQACHKIITEKPVTFTDKLSAVTPCLR